MLRKCPSCGSQKINRAVHGTVYFIRCRNCKFESVALEKQGATK